MHSEIITQIGVLFYPLGILSFLAAALIGERLIYFLNLSKVEKEKSFLYLREELRLNAGMTKPARDELMSFRLEDKNAQLTRGVSLLNLIGLLAPMVGLLGTVLGMIDAFKDIATQAGPVSPDLIAEGLGSAMMTTAYGLIIALPCLVAAYIFTRLAENRLEKYQRLLNNESLQIEGIRFYKADEMPV
jgi:biopolymer transport protein ExbB